MRPRALMKVLVRKRRRWKLLEDVREFFVCLALELRTSVRTDAWTPGLWEWGLNVWLPLF